MEQASNRFFYRINCELWADGLGDDRCSFLLTIPQFEEFKKCADDLEWNAYLDKGENIPVTMGIDSWTKKLVTKRYYKKYKSVLEDKGEAGSVLGAFNDFISDKGISVPSYSFGSASNEADVDDKDGLYYQVDCRVNLGPNGITSTIMLTNTELLALKKNHDPTKTAFAMGDWGEKTYVRIESWKEYVVSKKDYESLTEALHQRECEKKLLQAIERWVAADEEEELAAFIKATDSKQEQDKEKKDDNGDDNDKNEKNEDNRMEEEAEAEVEAEDDGDNSDDDEEIEEKPLEKKVKRN